MLTFLAFICGCLERYELFRRVLNVERDCQIASPPKVRHKVIEKVPDKKIQRVLFIGDVHGCFDELVELLKLFGVDQEETLHLLVFVGDIVNKGPKSIETLQFIRGLGKMAVCVRGNHEQAVLSRLENFKDDSNVLPKKYSWITSLSSEDKTYLEELPFTISLSFLNVIIVHGGLVPGVKLQNQRPVNMLNMRNYVHEEQSGTDKIDYGLPWGSEWPGPEFVIFGHDARRKLQKYKYSLGLDTGCLYGGHLTGFLVDLNEKHPLKNGQLRSVAAQNAYIKP